MDYTKPEMEVVIFESTGIVYTSGLGTSTDNFQEGTPTVPEIDAGDEF